MGCCCSFEYPLIENDDPCIMAYYEWIRFIVVFRHPTMSYMPKYLFIYTKKDKLYCFDTVALIIFPMAETERQRMGVWREPSSPNKAWFDSRQYIFAYIHNMPQSQHINIVFQTLKEWADSYTE